MNYRRAIQRSLLNTLPMKAKEYDAIKGADGSDCPPQTGGFQERTEKERWRMKR